MVLDPRRRFNGGERIALFLTAGGRCEACGVDLAAGFHGDHVVAHSRGGATDVTNGQALCPSCNLRKGSSAMTGRPLRAWQQRAIDKMDLSAGPNFLVSATPGAGKTTFALAAIRHFRGNFKRIVIVVPTSHLRFQWADAAAAVGLQLDPNFESSHLEPTTSFDGVVVTYSAVASQAHVYRRMSQNAFVVLDEIHHAGDQRSWGLAVRTAFDHAAKRLLLTGTPFRSDDNPIPYVSYAADEHGNLVSRADVAYNYGDALVDSDGVVRPIVFPALDGEGTWDDGGVTVSGRLHNELDDREAARALRTVLDPTGKWVPSVLRQAHRDLMDVRKEIPDAGGLIVAEDQGKAKRYAEVLAGITGDAPVLAISEDPEASKKIAAFADGTQPWLVAVRMVSEGVDIPRLIVGVWATNIKAELFFRQVVGRFVRTRRGAAGQADTSIATLYIPSLPTIITMARQIEREIDHALTVKTEEEIPRGGSGGGGTPRAIVPLTSTEAEHHATILSGDQLLTPSIEEATRRVTQMGLAPTTTNVAFAARLTAIIAAEGGTATALLPPPAADQPTTPVMATEAAYRKVTALKQKINTIVKRLCKRKGLEYSQINAELNRRVNIDSRDKATLTQLHQLLGYAEQWEYEQR